MLSPGRYHERVPRERVANLRFRRELLLRCQQSETARRAVRLACSQDILFFINAFCFIFEPRGSKVFPWSTWEYQDDAILAMLSAIEDQKNLVTTKSRDMGASWMLDAVVLWMWLYRKNGVFLVVSRIAELVDSENSDSLFWKIDFILDRLPSWLKPAKHVRRDMHFGNPETGSAINGVATTKGVGVGGRCTAMLVDEFSRIPVAEANEILQGTADTTRCRLFNYTFWGPMSHPSYDLVNHKAMRQLRLHWTLHPEKAVGLYQYDDDSKKIKVLDEGYEFDPSYKHICDGKVRSIWYDEEEALRNDPQGMALHVDMDVRGYGGQFFNKTTILELADKHVRDPLWEGDLHYDRDLADPIRLVEGEGGKLKLWLIPGVDGLPPVGAYAAGADVSRGTGATPSTFSIGNADTGEKVLEYIDYHIDPIDFASKCIAFCKMFKNSWGVGALWAWEIPGPGQSVSKRVEELRYTRVHRRSDEKKSFYASSPAETIAGWNNNRQTLPVLLEGYRDALYQGHVVNRSKQALSECLEFGFDKDGSLKHKAEKNSDPSATGVNHGDVVIADALMWKMMAHLGAGAPVAPAEKDERENLQSMKTLAYRRSLFEASARNGSRFDRIMAARR